MTLLVRRALAATTATAALFALAGCGDATDSKAAAKPAASPSASASNEPTPTAGSGQSITGDQFAALLKTALDKATTAHVTMDLGGLGSGHGDADYTTTPPELAMTLTMQALGGDVEIRLVDGKLYLKGSTFGDKWVSIPTDDPSSPLGALGGNFDLSKQLETFGAAVTEATDDGPEDVDGESLEHYTTKLDPKKMVASVPGASSSGAQLPDQLTAEWWFDGDGLIRKFSGDFGGTAIALTLSDWGTNVDIAAPPSDEVTTMPGSGTGGA
jgi:hypothetical protein